MRMSMVNFAAQVNGRSSIDYITKKIILFNQVKKLTAKQIHYSLLTDNDGCQCSISLRK